MTKKKTEKKTRKRITEFSTGCDCGETAPVFELENGYMVHCPNCGAVTFFHNPALLLRLSFGSKLCSHKLEAKPCRGGHTTWCSLCRMRTFYYDKGGTT